MAPTRSLHQLPLLTLRGWALVKGYTQGSSMLSCSCCRCQDGLRKAQPLAVIGRHQAAEQPCRSQWGHALRYSLVCSMTLRRDWRLRKGQRASPMVRHTLFSTLSPMPSCAAASCDQARSEARESCLQSGQRRSCLHLITQCIKPQRQAADPGSWHETAVTQHWCTPGCQDTKQSPAISKAGMH